MSEDPSTVASTATPTASNPWAQGSAAAGVAALGVGLLLAVLGGPSGYAADAGPATVRLAIGAGLSLTGLGLLLSALVIVGVGWYLRHPQAE
jgi:hypothetical protein